MSTRSGRCLCGAVTFEYEGSENWRGYCHCESCRRNTSSPVTAFFGVPRTAYRFTGAAPAAYESSPGVRRLFCRRCGTPMAYDADRFPDEIHFYAASLSDPKNFSPQAHFHYAERLPWLELKDDLPKHGLG
jgi:hypothetical protein